MNSGTGVVLQAGNDTADLGRGTRKVADQEEEAKRCTRVQTSNGNSAGSAEERTSECKSLFA